MYINDDSGRSNAIYENVDAGGTIQAVLEQRSKRQRFY